MKCVGAFSNLFSFQEMKESCARLLSESKLITTLVQLLNAAAAWVKENTSKAKSTATPK